MICTCIVGVLVAEMLASGLAQAQSASISRSNPRRDNTVSCRIRHSLHTRINCCFRIGRVYNGGATSSRGSEGILVAYDIDTTSSEHTTGYARMDTLERKRVSKAETAVVVYTGEGCDGAAGDMRRIYDG